MVSELYASFLFFHTATGETTAAPSEETTSVPTGKSWINAGRVARPRDDVY